MSAAAYLVSEYKNAIIAENADEMFAIVRGLEAASSDNGNMATVYSVSAPNSEQPSLSDILESATTAADHWQEDTGLSWSPIGIEDREWRMDGVDSADGPL